MNIYSLQIVEKALAKNGEKKNMISSPLSIAAMSNILAFEGGGQQDMLQLLGSKTLDDLKSNYAKLAAASSSFSDTCQGDDPVLNFVNGAWANQNYGFDLSFEQALKSVFNAETKLLNFDKKKDESVEEINSWVKKSTNGLIKEIVKYVDNGTIMILANAIYFKGKWEEKFELDIFDRYFYTGKDKKFLAPFMLGTESYKYKSFETFKVASIPYKSRQDVSSKERHVKKSRHDIVRDFDDDDDDGLFPQKEKDAPASREDARKFSMNLFLPNEKDGLPALVKEFSANPSLFLSETLSALSRQEFAVILIPKFSFSYEFELQDFMAELGFDTGGKMVIQKARIIVDEDGTEAAAVTYTEECDDDGSDCDSPRKLPIFVADHPFMFVIREDTTGTPFFVGVVVNPLVVE